MIKRAFDVVIGTVTLGVLAPLLALIALAVWASVGRPVLFTQRRAGWRGTAFALTKFRSMRDLRDAEGAPLPDELRTTRVGWFLRRTRLDELPELVLILTGKMSFVGPRPLYPETVMASSLGHRRGSVRPGLTGLAQVSGNTHLNDAEKIALDVYYVDKNGFGGDLAILLRTLGVLLFGERRNETLIRKALAYANSLDRGG